MMPEPFNKVRIIDIAHMAGVSSGTVDRVIHNRGQVSEEKREKILSIIENIHYQPNIIARSLAMKKTFHFASLLPECKAGEYWKAPEKGIDRAQVEMRNYNISIEKLYFNQFNAQSFVAVSGKLLDANPDAVLIAPTFRKEAARLMEQLHAKNVPGVYIDSNTEDEFYLSYFGQHSYQSGYAAARLLENGLLPGSEILVARTLRIAGTSNQTERREEGFMAYFKANGLMNKYHFIQVKMSADDNAGNQRDIEQIFKKSSHIRTAIMFNSRVYQLAGILKKMKIKDVKLIGYDLSGGNVAALKDESVSFLIAQRPEDQGYQGIMALCNHLVFNKKIKRVNYMPIDILTKENIDYYINYINY
ncbi:MAG: substrate-binding domain-containing protein [Bacteroidales bacterium]|jgi:LacI family transcriptional regulator|nr:substrate-binding domain-containing protein [Bacteroidales bacterium]